MLKTRDFLSRELKKRTRIDETVMKQLELMHGISRDEQVAVFYSLVKENNALDLIFNSNEYVFISLMDDIEDFDYLEKQSLSFKMSDIKHKLIKYIHYLGSDYDPLEFFIDYGIPVDIQKKCLDILLYENRIEKSESGFRIKKVTNNK